MTLIQHRIFEYIALKRIAGKSVSIRDIQRDFGYHSPFTVQRHLANLKKLGMVTWEAGLVNTLVTTYKFIPADQLDSSPVHGEQHGSN